jgi:GTP-dependent phosphoenolpyruvate carboxykinase
MEGRTNPMLWEQSKKDAIKKMGGLFSARAMQLAGKIYREKGGDYYGSKTKAQKSLTKWTGEDWRTKSGKPSAETGERYLPAKAIKVLSGAEYGATTRLKREGMKKGIQFVKQPKTIIEKVKKFR